MAYWVFKRHPIQYINKLPDDVLIKFEKFRYINEACAVFLLTSFVFDMKTHLMLGKPTNVPAFQRELMYNFIYRRVSPQELEIILTALLTTYPHPQLNNNDKLQD